MTTHEYMMFHCHTCFTQHIDEASAQDCKDQDHSVTVVTSKELLDKFIVKGKEIQKEFPTVKDFDIMPIFNLHHKFTNERFNDLVNHLKKNHDFLTVVETDTVYYYAKKLQVYKPYGDSLISMLTRYYVENCKKKTVSEVIAGIKDTTPISMDKLFNSDVINVQNGILDPMTFTIMPHSPRYYTISKLPFKVDPTVRNLKLWLLILDIINPLDVNIFLEILWIGISWRNPYKKMVVFKGPPNTRKSTASDIIAMIIGNDNISRQHPSKFLGKFGSRFTSSNFLGKRMNMASEIGNLTKDELENQKALVGAEKQDTERKYSNEPRAFDPTRFLFLYTTNKLGADYNTITDPSVITRYQFLIFKNQILDAELDGLYMDNFFENEDDRQTAISTIVNIVIAYKKAQVAGRAPKTHWSTIEETKQILKESISKDDLYFEEARIVEKVGSKLTLEEIASDFSRYVGREVKNQEMGIIMHANGFKSNRSNGIKYFKNRAFALPEEQEILTK